MSDLPAELKDFPTDLLDKLRAGELEGPDITQRRAWLDQLAGWLMRLGYMASQAHGQYKVKTVETKRAWAKTYKQQRSLEGSVSGAKNAADTSDSYLDALDAEIKVESQWRVVSGIHSDTLEIMQAIKKSIDAQSSEMKYIGRD